MYTTARVNRVESDSRHSGYEYAEEMKREEFEKRRKNEEASCGLEPLALPRNARRNVIIDCLTGVLPPATSSNSH